MRSHIVRLKLYKLRDLRMLFSSTLLSLPGEDTVQAIEALSAEFEVPSLGKLARNIPTHL